jgi:hypothetical protein
MNSAECWQSLPAKVNILLSEFFWQLISDSWTCYRINSVSKNCCMYFEWQRTRASIPLYLWAQPSPQPPSNHFPPISSPFSSLMSLQSRLPSLPFHFLPFIPSRLFSLFPFSSCPLSSPLFLPVEAGSEVISRKIFGLLQFCTWMSMYFLRVRCFVWRKRLLYGF